MLNHWWPKVLLMCTLTIVLKPAELMYLHYTYMYVIRYFNVLYVTVSLQLRILLAQKRNYQMWL